MRYPITVLLLCSVLALLPYAKAFGRLELGVVTFNPYLLGLFALAPLAAFRVLQRPWTYGFRVTDVFIFLLGVSYLSSTFQAKDILDSGYLAFHSLFVPAVSFFVIKATLRTEAEYRLVLQVFLAAVALYAVATLVTFATVLQRPVVFSVPPIGVATILIVAVIYLFCARAWRKPIGFIGLVITVAALIVTLSRVYLLVLLAAPLLYQQFRKGRALLVFTTTLVATLALTIFIAASPQLFYFEGVEAEDVKRLTRLVDLDYWKYAMYGRAISYGEGLEGFQDNLYFGTGLYKGEIMITRHNFHIEWLEYGGLVGYFLYCAVFLSHAASVGRWAVKDPYIAVNLLVLFTILLNSLTNGFMHGVIPYVAYIMLGLSEARLTMLRRAASSRKPARPLMHAASA